MKIRVKLPVETIQLPNFKVETDKGERYSVSGATVTVPAREVDADVTATKFQEVVRDENGEISGVVTAEL